MFGFSFGELLVISLVTLVAVGPQKLPGMLKTMGQWARKLRKMTMDVRQQTGIDEMLRAEGIQISELRSLMRGYHGGVAAPVAPAPAPAPAPVRPSYEDPYANVEPDPTREYPPEGADAYGALPDDLLEPAPPKPQAEAPDADGPAVDAPAAVEGAPAPRAPAAIEPAATVEVAPAALAPAVVAPATVEVAPAVVAPATPPQATPSASPAVSKPAAAPPPAPVRTAPPPPPSSRPAATVPRPSGTPPPPPRRTAPPPPRPEPSSPVNPPSASGTGNTNGNG